MAKNSCANVPNGQIWMDGPNTPMRMITASEQNGGKLMIKAEAIEVLKSNYPDPHYSLLREAVDIKNQEKAGRI